MEIPDTHDLPGEGAGRQIEERLGELERALGLLDAAAAQRLNELETALEALDGRVRNLRNES